MNIRDFPKLVNYELVSLSTQRVIINGQEQIIEQKTTVIKCPVCNNIIMNLGQAVPEAYIRRMLNDDKEQLYARMQHCPYCGQKLQYETEIIEGQLIEETQNENMDL